MIKNDWLYKNKQGAQERIKKIRELGYKNSSAIDLGDDGIRIQEIWCHHCISNWKSVVKVWILNPPPRDPKM
jgi:hypothetical protein